MAALGRLTGLSSLSMDWRLGPVKAREPTVPPLPALPDAAGLHLLSLTSLTSLRMVFLQQQDVGAGPSEQVPRRAAPLTVAPLRKLRRLGLPGCSSIGLALSVGRLGATLEELDLSCCSAAITPGLVVQVRHKREARPLACISSAINLDLVTQNQSVTRQESLLVTHTAAAPSPSLPSPRSAPSCHSSRP